MVTLSRIVLAETTTHEIVYYASKKKYWVEPKNRNLPRRVIGLDDAVGMAELYIITGGKVHLGLPGAEPFDNEWKRRLEEL